MTSGVNRFLAVGCRKRSTGDVITMIGSSTCSMVRQVDRSRIDRVQQPRYLVGKFAEKTLFELVDGRERIGVERLEAFQETVELDQRTFRAGIRFVAIQ